jgi:hypothetical protein
VPRAARGGSLTTSRGCFSRSNAAALWLLEQQFPCCDEARWRAPGKLLEGTELELATTLMNIFWFLPTHGDGRYLGTTRGARAVSYPYLQIAQAADELGFGGVLLPTGRSCEDAWAVASSLLAATQKLRFLVAIRPGIISSTAASRLTSTVDRLSNGRLLINVVTGGDPAEAEGDGIFLPHDERYAVTAEFLEIWKRVLAGESPSEAGSLPIESDVGGAVARIRGKRKSSERMTRWTARKRCASGRMSPRRCRGGTRARGATCKR